MLIPLDKNVLTGNTVEMKKCRVGDEVALEKSNTKEVFVGTVVQLRKPAQYMLYINVTTYFKEGRHRPRWQTKVKGFRNSSKIKIHRTSDPAVQRQQQAKARKAYSKHRNLLGNRRDEANEFISLLQEQAGDKLNITVDLRMNDADLKKLYRAVAFDFHPDRLQQASESKQEFGIKMMDAIASFRHMKSKVAG